MKRRKLSKVKIVLLSVASFLIFFLGFVLIRALTFDTSLDLNTTFSLPEFASTEELSTISGYNYAVATDGEVISGNKQDEVRPTASTAKMILGLAVMNEKPFNLGESGETVKINNDMLKRYLYYLAKGGSNTKVLFGEEINEYDALASVFLASSNNMADSLAIWAFGSLESYHDYAEKMLAEWGMTNTTKGPSRPGWPQ